MKDGVREGSGAKGTERQKAPNMPIRIWNTDS